MSDTFTNPSEVSPLVKRLAALEAENAALRACVEADDALLFNIYWDDTDVDLRFGTWSKWFQSRESRDAARALIGKGAP